MRDAMLPFLTRPHSECRLMWQEDPVLHHLFPSDMNHGSIYLTKWRFCAVKINDHASYYLCWRRKRSRSMYFLFTNDWVSNRSMEVRCRRLRIQKAGKCLIIPAYPTGTVTVAFHKLFSPCKRLGSGCKLRECMKFCRMGDSICILLKRKGRYEKVTTFSWLCLRIHFRLLKNVVDWRGREVSRRSAVEDIKVR